MDRTIPSRASDDISLYIRTYYSLLRSSDNVRIKTLIEAHLRTKSALHVNAMQPEPDMAAFIYSILRLPACLIAEVNLVILGQSAELFNKHGFSDIETWQRVSQPARRRPGFFDGKHTLAIYITSRSDIDDLIPILTAYQIERDKMHQIFSQSHTLALLKSLKGNDLTDEALDHLALNTQISRGDLDRLRRIWKDEAISNLIAIAEIDLSVSVRLLGGSFTDYSRSTHIWWDNIAQNVPAIDFGTRPIYFVSSNTHSLSNLISGYALQNEQRLIEYITACGDKHLQSEYEDIVRENVPSSRENFLYYALKKYESAHAESIAERKMHEQNAGIIRVPSKAAYDVETQVILLNDINFEWLDPRLQLEGIEKLKDSNALIINIDFPLGMAAYHILAQISRNTNDILGVYIMGKAATLNGRIGDVLIPKVVHDEQSNNSYLFSNCFTADEVTPYLTYGNILDNQKAMTVRGTFLQNEEYMAVFYKEGYTILEMEGGPYLSSIYEMVRPQRYPINEIVNLYEAKFPIGFLHYASDTPFSKGKNLGAQNLSYFGMDPTYATMVAILREIFQQELVRLTIND